MVGKAYADWVSRAPELKGASQFIHDPPSLYAAGIEPVYVPTRLPMRGSYHPGRTVSVKNSVDVKMTADCIDTAHNFPNINTFVLVSGDSDFIHVINSLRAVGKRVLVVGVSWTTSRRMADHVDGLIFYDSDVDPIEAEPVAPRGPAQRIGRAPAPAALANPGRHQLPEVIRAIEDVIRTERAAGHTLLLTSLKQRLVRRIAGFDERKLGFSGFKKLMLRVAEEGNIKIRSVDLVDWVLMADEPDPAPEIRDDDDAAEPQPPDSYAADAIVAPVAEPQPQPEPTTDAAVAAAPTPPSVPAIPNPAPAPAPSPAPPRPAAADEQDHILADAVAALSLPPSDDAQRDVSRIADLVVMGYTLELRDGADSVMFNALCSEISQALAAGIAAAEPTILDHWGENNSRTYIIRLVRSLADNGVFQYRNVSARDPETNRLRRRRVFGLNRAHPVTGMALAVRLGLPYAPADDTLPNDDTPPTNDAIATPPLTEHNSAEADGPESAADAEAAVLSR